MGVSVRGLNIHNRPVTVWEGPENLAERNNIHLHVGAKTVPSCSWICASMWVYRLCCIHFQLLGSPRCHGNQFWVFCLVIGGELERSENELKVLRCAEHNASCKNTHTHTYTKKKKKKKLNLLHETHPAKGSLWYLLISQSESYDYKLKFVVNCCQFGDPVISTHFPGEWRQPTGYSCKPWSAVQPGRVLVAHTMGGAVVIVLILYDSEYIA